METLKEEPDSEEHYSSTESRSSMYTCLVPPLSDKVLFITDISFRPICFSQKHFISIGLTKASFCRLAHQTVINSLPPWNL